MPNIHSCLEPYKINTCIYQITTFQIKWILLLPYNLYFAKNGENINNVSPVIPKEAYSRIWSKNSKRWFGFDETVSFDAWHVNWKLPKHFGKFENNTY